MKKKRKDVPIHQITVAELECRLTDEFKLYDINGIRLMYSFDSEYFTIYVKGAPFKAVKAIGLAVSIFNNLI